MDRLAKYVERPNMYLPPEPPKPQKAAPVKKETQE